MIRTRATVPDFSPIWTLVVDTSFRNSIKYDSRSVIYCKLISFKYKWLIYTTLPTLVFVWWLSIACFVRYGWNIWESLKVNYVYVYYFRNIHFITYSCFIGAIALSMLLFIFCILYATKKLLIWYRLLWKWKL